MIEFAKTMNAEFKRELRGLKSDSRRAKDLKEQIAKNDLYIKSQGAKY